MFVFRIIIIIIIKYNVLVGIITHVSIDTLTIRTRYNGTTRIKLACVYTTNIWKAAFLRKHPLAPLTYK